MSAPTTSRGPLTRAQVAVRVGLTVVVLAIVAMWVYAFGFAEKQGVYVLDDEAWTERAEEICDRYEQQRIALADTDEGYIENPTEEQMLQRADIVDRATDLLEAELAEVFAVLPASARDQEIALEYRGYYETLIGDRRAYTARLRAFELAPYYETVVDGGPVTNMLLDFTTANRMKRCAPPGELGGDSIG
ncbi:MAG: hypothetical protein KDB40_18465 [Acidimicrobiales bacterium]|nr:hypothetical protein [Acidimicrobiales bacterium]